METYYEENFEDSTYSDIIESLFPSTEEQRAFLENFFENKAPGKAHKLIAEWVKAELIRFIITTNFDSSIEHSLDDVGLRGKYSVITDGAQVLTSKPWHLVENCRIYKVHGTIEQGEIKNTQKNLEKFDNDLENEFLDIIERHGVIVLGYAGNKEDKAVMDCFNKRRFKGYTLYWTVHDNQIKDNVKELVEERQDGRFIHIESASDFLEDVLNRVEIARKGTEQTSEAVAQVRFKNLITSGSDVEIRQTIDEERRKLKKYFETILDEVDEEDYKSLWDGYLKLFNYSFNFLSLVDQIIKYQNKYWENILPVFEEIQSLNKNRSQHGKEGLVNYYFFTLLEMIGGILLENKAFQLLHSLLAVKKLNYTKDGMEPILDWDTYAHFIEVKNDEEAKETGQNWIVPRMHYLCQLIESQEIPFEYDLRGRIVDVDLLYFVYPVIHPMGRYSYYWSPESSIYSRGDSSELFKKIKYDGTFGTAVANELFNISYEELVEKLGEAKESFNTNVIGSFHTPWVGNPFEDF
ncbi:SIR2-like domain-containing protein [Methanophagales archaeon]|nr:SIR2-like domain-containing protein [Methanophagales archaeon]